MVFQKTNPFPKSIFENVAYGLRVKGHRQKSVLADAVEHSLKRASLWRRSSRQAAGVGSLALRRSATAPMYCSGAGG